MSDVDIGFRIVGGHGGNNNLSTKAGDIVATEVEPMRFECDRRVSTG